MLLELFQKKNSTVVGIDISSSAIKLLELSEHPDGFRVESYASEPLPPDAMEESVIKDVDAVGAVIARAVKRSRTHIKQASIAVAGSVVITKTIKMNAGLTDSELENQVIFEAERYIPYPLEEVNLDFQVLGLSPDNNSMLDVLLVASRSENVDSRVEVLALGGLNAKVVDIEAYAIERSFRFIQDMLPNQGMGQLVAILDIGSTMTTLHVLHDAKIIYTREQIFGGRALTEEIQRRYNLSFEEAGLAKKQGGLPEDYEFEVLAPFLNATVQQVSRALQYFFSSTDFDKIDHIVLAGGTANVPSLETLLEKELKTPTIVANPFLNMTLSPRVSVSAIQSDASALLIGCGLAMRSFKDDY